MGANGQTTKQMTKAAAKPAPEADTKKKTALVTGASSGLGLELAQLFAADGSPFGRQRFAVIGNCRPGQQPATLQASQHQAHRLPGDKHGPGQL